MYCEQCGGELLPGKAFCHACGVPVRKVCQGCGSQVAVNYKFCPDCGWRLKERAESQDLRVRVEGSMPQQLASKILASRASVEGERRQVTVLFCDLVGSTTIAERLDPEEYHDLLDRYLEIAFEEIYRYEGVVTQIAGDGLMAIFGAPVAHGDSPQRALFASLGIRERVAKFTPPKTGGAKLKVRIGVNTGPVVVGAVGNDLKMDYTAIGDTTNLAARLQALARPGEIIVSESTYRMAKGLFRFRFLGPIEIRGKLQPVEAYELVEQAELGSALAVAEERGLTPLADRKEELRQLQGVFRRLAPGAGHVVCLVGEAGMGKSRLVHEFKRWLADKEATIFEGQCFSYNRALPYFPFIMMLRNYFAGSSAGIEARCKLDRESLSPFLGRVLSLKDEELHELIGDARAQSLDAVVNVIVEESCKRAAVVILEDVQWIDEASQELLDNLVNRISAARVMVLVTFRPEYSPPWGHRSYLSETSLSRLADEDARRMVWALTQGRLGEEVERAVVEKAEGNPHFLEEIAREILESGGPLPAARAPAGGLAEAIRIPATLKEVIAARLDRLGPEVRRVVQVASVIGREFDRALLAQALGIDVGELDPVLEQLQRAEIFRVRTATSKEEFAFRSSLLREVAYEGLLVKQRRQLHGRVARLLEERFSPRLDEKAGLIAYHYCHSDEESRAIDFWLRAGAYAERLPSYRAAARAYADAWRLAARHEGGGEQALERKLRAGLGLCASSVVFGMPEPAGIEDVLREVVALSERAGDPQARIMALGLLGGRLTSADAATFEEGLCCMRQAWKLACAGPRSASALHAARNLALAEALDGRFAEALALVEEVLRWEREGSVVAPHIFLTVRWVRDTIYMLADRFDAAWTSARETLESAEDAGNRTVQSGIAAVLVEIAMLRGDLASVCRFGERGLKLAQEINNAGPQPALASALALAACARQDRGAASRYLDLLEDSLRAPPNIQQNPSLAVPAFVAAGQLGRAQRLMGLLRRRSGGRLGRAHVELAQGELSWHMGLSCWRQADQHFSRALELAEAIRSARIAALARLGKARIALARGESGQCERLVSLILPVFTRLGMSPAARSAREILARIGQREGALAESGQQSTRGV